MYKVWIIEDDAMYAQMLKRQIEKSSGFEADIYSNAEQVFGLKPELFPAAVFLDYQLPGDNGTKVLEYVQKVDKDLPVIVVSGQEDPTVAVKLIRQGAYDYLTKSVETPKMLTSILAKLTNQLRMKSELEALRKELNKKHDFVETMGQSAAMTKQVPLFEKASKSAIPVSLFGDAGVGKERAARVIHFNSPRAVHPFVTMQLGSIPSNEFEAAFLGSETSSCIFEEVSNGTLFLDEISELDVYNQGKLLKILQDGKYKTHDAKEEKDIACRLIVSSNKNLKELVRTGAFREDLYYKLLGLPIAIPSLKDRRSDIILLARKFANAFCRQNEMDLLRFSKEAQDKLLDYNWPGNVRELKAVIELACVVANGDELTGEDIRYEDTSPSEDLLSKERSLREYTASIIEYFMQKYEGDIPKVAQVLDIGKSTIYRMIKNNEIKQIK